MFPNLKDTNKRENQKNEKNMDSPQNVTCSNIHGLIIWFLCVFFTGRAEPEEQIKYVEGLQIEAYDSIMTLTRWTTTHIMDRSGFPLYPPHSSVAAIIVLLVEQVIYTSSTTSSSGKNNIIRYYYYSFACCFLVVWSWWMSSSML